MCTRYCLVYWQLKPFFFMIRTRFVGASLSLVCPVKPKLAQAAGGVCFWLSRHVLGGYLQPPQLVSYVPWVEDGAEKWDKFSFGFAAALEQV